QNLQHAPNCCGARMLIRSAVLNKRCQRRAREQSAKMSSVVDITSSRVTDNEIDYNDRHHTGTEGTFETFRQLTPKLDPEDKKNADQAKQGAGSSCRRTIARLEDETGERISR